jgi:hypothetical protein
MFTITKEQQYPLFAQIFLRKLNLTKYLNIKHTSIDDQRGGREDVEGTNG